MLTDAPPCGKVSQLRVGADVEALDRIPFGRVKHRALVSRPDRPNLFHDSAGAWEEVHQESAPWSVDFF